jgi:hypothetical protein
MRQDLRRAVRLGWVAALVLAAGSRAHPYIDTLVCPLEQFNSTFQVIAEGVVEKVDAGKKVCLIKIGKVLRGKPEITHIRLNVGAGQDDHPDVVMPQLVPGAPLILWFYWGEGPKAAIYVNRLFLEAYRNQDGAPPDPSRVWWHFSSIAVLYNRTFNGSVEELAALLPDLLAGKKKGPAPDPKLPPITRASVAALPPWGTPSIPSRLPLCFRPRVQAGTPRAADPVGPLRPGLNVRSFQGTWESLPDLARQTPLRSGACERIELAARPGDAGYALQFSGYLDVPRAGVYTFTLASNDGSRLWIGDLELINNDHFKSVVESSGEIALQAGKHAFRLEYFQHSGFQGLDLAWEAPGLPRQRIPDAAWFRP